MTRTLILSCSATKRAAPGEIPAIDCYDGPAFRTLRVNRPSSIKSGRVWILSARHGLINELEPISDYDERMKAPRAAAIAPKVGERLLELERRQVLGRDIFFIGGATYRECIGRAIGGAYLLDRFHFASGGIGEQLAQLKAWLRRDA